MGYVLFFFATVFTLQVGRTGISVVAIGREENIYLRTWNPDFRPAYTLFDLTWREAQSVKGTRPTQACKITWKDKDD